MTGIICALNEEVSGIIEKIEKKETKTAAKMTFYSGQINKRETVVAECGVGKVNAAMCAQIMIDLFSPDVIINSGIAGSLCSNIKIGDIVLASDCVQHDYDTTELGDPKGLIYFNDEKLINIESDRSVTKKLKNACSHLKDTQIITGKIATGDSFISDRKRRSSIASEFNAVACEMEGGAIAQVCYRNSVPFAILRCISDDFMMNESMDYFKFKMLASEKTIGIIDRFFNTY